MAKARKNSKLSKKTTLKLKTQNGFSPLEQALINAEEYFKAGKYELLLETLLPFENDYPFDQVQLTAVYDHLLAFGYASLKQIEKAEVALTRSEAMTDDSLDYHYLRAYIFKALKDYEEKRSRFRNRN